MIIQSKPENEAFLLKGKLNLKRIQTNINFTLNGRTAIQKLALKIGLIPGDKLLVPAFICYSAIEPLIKQGIIPIYYDIDLSLKINWSIILSHLKKEKITAILIVNYFGFIDEEKKRILSLCSKYNLKVIDDYCHSFLTYLLSNNSNNLIHGQNIAFNLNKIIRTKCGAYICGSQNKKKTYLIGKKNNLKSFLAFIFNKLELLNKKYKVINIYSKKFNIIKNLISKFIFINKDFNSTNNLRPNYLIAHVITDMKYLKEIKNKRITNYLFLYKKFKAIGINPIQEISDSYSVPQVIAIEDNKGGLNQFLRNKGIGSYRWPDEELPKFSNEQKKGLKNTLILHKRIVCLPVHHSLNVFDMEIITESVRVFFKL